METQRDFKARLVTSYPPPKKMIAVFYDDRNKEIFRDEVFMIDVYECKLYDKHVDVDDDLPSDVSSAHIPQTVCNSKYDPISDVCSGNLLGYEYEGKEIDWSSEIRKQ